MSKETSQPVENTFQGTLLPTYAWGRPDIGIVKAAEVETMWDGYTLAPDAKYGNWPKDVVPFDEYDPPLKQWFQDYGQRIQKGQSILAADIGCGNGGSSIEGYSSLLLDHPNSTIALVDLQQVGVDQATLMFRSSVAQALTVPIVGDMSDITLVDRIKSVTEGRFLDAATCIKALYFCSGDQLEKAINNLAEILRPGGSLYLTLVSIYNPMGIGMNNQDALQKMQVLTNDGHLNEPLTIYQPEMGSVVSLFTPESIRTSFNGSGLQIEKQTNIWWNKNGFGENYPEAYGVSLIKQ